jgi:uncharacterized protein (DUF58 family)
MPRTLRATRAGWCFVVIVFGVGFAALNTGNNLLYLVLSLLLAFLVLSGLLSESSLRGLRVERRLPREIFAGAPNRISLRIHNDLSRTPSFAVSIEDLFAGDEELEESGRSFVLRVGPKDAVDRSYDFEPSRRGDMAFVACRLSTRFPFGLFVKSVDLDLQTQALVYPQLQDLSATDEPHGTLEIGEERRRRSSEGDVLSSLREYVEGDPVQRIHWRRSLHARTLIVGEREGEKSAQIEVLLSIPEGLDSAEIEHRISRATSEVVQHLDRGRQVGLRTTSNRFAASAGFAHRTELLSFLARVKADPAQLAETAPLAEAMAIEDAPAGVAR